MKRILLLLLFLFLLSCVKQKTNNEPVKPTKSTQTRNADAIVIGIANYPNISPLDYSVKDATDMKSALINYVGIPSERIIFLTNEKATKSAISLAFKTIAKNSVNSDFVVIYYSGHGGFGPDKDGDEVDGYDEYILPYDVKSGSLSSAISDDSLSVWVSKIPTKVLFILDSCYGGGAARFALIGQDTIPSIPGKPRFFDFMNITSSRDFNPTEEVEKDTIGLFEEVSATKRAAKPGVVDDQAGVKGRVYITASKYNEQSWEFDDIKHGIFTNFVLEALKIKGSTVESIFNYASQKVIAENTKRNFSQKPTIINREEAKTLILVK